MNYDSILTAIDSTCINRSEFYQTGKDVPDHDIAMVERVLSVGSDDVLLAILLVLILVAAAIVYRSRDLLLYRLRTFFSSGRLNSTVAVSDSLAEPYYVFLLVHVTAMSFALPLYQLQAMQCTYVSLVGHPRWLLFALFGAIELFILLKWVMYEIINWTFFDREQINRWQHSYYFVTAFFAYLILPVSTYLLLSECTAEVVTQTLVFMVICYEILLLLRLFINFTPRLYGSLSFFLYFCSAELIPAIILWRLHDVAAEWLSIYHIVE